MIVKLWSGLFSASPPGGTSVLALETDEALNDVSCCRTPEAAIPKALPTVVLLLFATV